MKCPNCGLINPESAQRCECCGYDFDKGTIEKPYYREEKIIEEQANTTTSAFCLQSFWQREHNLFIFFHSLYLLPTIIFFSISF